MSMSNRTAKRFGAEDEDSSLKPTSIPGRDGSRESHEPRANAGTTGQLLAQNSSSTTADELQLGTFDIESNPVTNLQQGRNDGPHEAPVSRASAIDDDFVGSLRPSSKGILASKKCERTDLQNQAPSSTTNGTSPANDTHDNHSGREPNNNHNTSASITPELTSDYEERTVAPTNLEQGVGEEAFEAVLASENRQDTLRGVMDGAVTAVDVRADKPNTRGRRKWIPIVVISVLLTLAGVGAALGVVFGRKNKNGTGGDSEVAPTAFPSQSPTLAPTGSPTSIEFSQVAALVESLFGDDTLVDASSPQYRAAEWMAHVDLGDLSTVNPE